MNEHAASRSTLLIISEDDTFFLLSLSSFQSGEKMVGEEKQETGELIKRGEQMDEGGKGESSYRIKMMEDEKGEKLWRGEGESSPSRNSVIMGTMESLERV